MGNASDKTYEIWVQVGDKGGPFEPKDPSRLETLTEAMKLASEVLKTGDYDKVILIQKRVVQVLNKYKGEG